MSGNFSETASPKIVVANGDAESGDAAAGRTQRLLAAGGILTIIPVLVLFAIVQRSMIRGLSAGAVKG